MRYLAILLPLLSGCTALDAIQAAPDDDRLLTVLHVAQTDVSAAYALAEAAGDEVAMACWPALGDWLVHLEEYRAMAEEVEGSGVAVAYQRARNVRRRLEAGVPVELELQCAALFSDSTSFLRRLVLRLGL